MAGPQRGATEEPNDSWAASPRAAKVIRALVFLVPLVGAWLAVRLTAPLFSQPPGWFGLGVWTVQALVVGAVSALALDRVAKRALPLATLLGMSLTFPDQAPNRFSVAMRTGTVRQMKKRLDELATNGLDDDVQTAAEQAIELVTLLGRHERLTRGHTERVRAYADVIAVEMGLPEHDRQMLSWGVLLHDIGKLTVPPEILNKDGRPTEEEWAILQQHPAEGARILAPLAGWLGDWALAASEHHERWDGNGYPNKLSGGEISLAGRITAVADAYDVITSRRSYKSPMSVESARRELVRCSKTQFDPAVVRAMLASSVEEKRGLARSLSGLAQVPGVAAVTNATVTNAALLLPTAVVATALAVSAALAAEHSQPTQLLAVVPITTSAPTTVDGSSNEFVTDTTISTFDAVGDTTPTTTSSTGTASASTTGPTTTWSDAAGSDTAGADTTLPSTTLPDTTLPGATVPEVTLPGVTLPPVVSDLVDDLVGDLVGDLVPDLEVPTDDLTGGLLPELTVPAGELVDGLLSNPPPEDGSTTTTPPLTLPELPDLGLGGLGFLSQSTNGSTTTAPASG